MFSNLKYVDLYRVINSFYSITDYAVITSRELRSMATMPLASVF